jgi:hypothetical protein
LAAKLKDEWERERRRQVERDKEMERGGVSRGGKVRINTEREEGEVLRR